MGLWKDIFLSHFYADRHQEIPKMARNDQNGCCAGPLPAVAISRSAAKCNSVPAKISPPQYLYQIWQLMLVRTGWHFHSWCQETLSCEPESGSHLGYVPFVAENMPRSTGSFHHTFLHQRVTSDEMRLHHTKQEGINVPPKKHCRAPHKGRWQESQRRDEDEISPLASSFILVNKKKSCFSKIEISDWDNCCLSKLRWVYSRKGEKTKKKNIFSC